MSMYLGKVGLFGATSEKWGWGLTKSSHNRPYRTPTPEIRFGSIRAHIHCVLHKGGNVTTSPHHQYLTLPPVPHPPPLRYAHHQHLGVDLAVGIDGIHSDDPEQAQQRRKQFRKHDKLHRNKSAKGQLECFFIPAHPFAPEPASLAAACHFSPHRYQSVYGTCRPADFRHTRATWSVVINRGYWGG